jgi:predicted porin
MKKHLIAVAVAGAFAVPAMAQVTVYGLVDVGYGSTETKFTVGAGNTNASHTTKASTTGASGQQSGSRLGVRGEEDLGGGLKAGFTYELGVNPQKSNGFADMSNRQAFLSMSGGFGQIRIGRQYTGFFQVNAGYDVNGTVGAAGYLPSSTQLGSTEWTGAIRADNVISYTSPAMSGFQVGLSMAQDKAESNNTNNPAAPATIPNERIDSETSGWTIGLSYNAGPLSAMLTRQTSESKALAVSGVVPSVDRAGRLSASASDAEVVRTNLGVSYNLGVAKVSLVHNMKDVDSKLASNFDSSYSDTTIGVSVPVGALTIGASMGQGELKADTTAASATTAQTAGKLAEYDAYQITASYALSKRTNIYFLYGQDEGTRKQTSSVGTTARNGDKTTNSGTHIGLRHTF